MSPKSMMTSSLKTWPPAMMEMAGDQTRSGIEESPSPARSLSGRRWSSSWAAPVASNTGRWFHYGVRALGPRVPGNPCLQWGLSREGDSVVSWKCGLEELALQLHVGQDEGEGLVLWAQAVCQGSPLPAGDWSPPEGICLRARVHRELEFMPRTLSVVFRTACGTLIER